MPRGPSDRPSAGASAPEQPEAGRVREDAARGRDEAPAAERIAELERANERLRAELRARDDFLAVASHDLRSPVTVLGLQIQILQRETRKDESPLLTPAELASRLEGVSRQLRRLTTQLNRLLDISRVTFGQILLEPEQLDLVEVVREVIASHTNELRESGCALTLSAPTSVTGVWDRVRLDQVISNLLTNAMKYGAGRSIEVAVEGRLSQAVLTVRDHGAGIAREDQVRIFERFERAGQVLRHGGFGLGLWISRQTLQAMGGDIAVESEPGQGALFTVTLPRGGRLPPPGRSDR